MELVEAVAAADDLEPDELAQAKTRLSSQGRRRSGSQRRDVPVKVRDAIIVALVLRGFLRSSGDDVLRELWPGPEQSLAHILRLADGRAHNAAAGGDSCCAQRRKGGRAV